MNKETNRRGNMKMNDRIYRVLEFHKIIEQLKQQTETSLGKQLASQIAPKTILTEVNQTQLETDEAAQISRSEEHTSELQSRGHLVCRLLLEKKKKKEDKRKRDTKNDNDYIR